MKEQRQLVNPFSDVFWPSWNLWKDFRWEEHKFKYKGVISEQMALKRLVEVSEGEEEKAVRIIEQSISRGWMDFYKLKQPSNNGKSAAKKSTPKPAAKTAADRVSDVQAELARRNEKRGQPGSGDYLKAV